MTTSTTIIVLKAVMLCMLFGTSCIVKANPAFTRSSNHQYKLYRYGDTINHQKYHNAKVLQSRYRSSSDRRRNSIMIKHEQLLHRMRGGMMSSNNGKDDGDPSSQAPPAESYYNDNNNNDNNTYDYNSSNNNNNNNYNADATADNYSQNGYNDDTTTNFDQQLDPMQQQQEPQETVQDRIDAWRTQQQQQQQSSATGTANEQRQTSLRDETGRVRLLTSIPKQSRGVVFALNIFRSLHLYDVACTRSSASTGMAKLFRTLLPLPVLVLFLGNLFGAVSTFFVKSTSSNTVVKRRLKAVLNLNTFVELLLLVNCVLQLCMMPANTEVYIVGIFHCMFFIANNHAYTKLTWDDSGKSSVPISSYSRGNNIQQNQQQRAQQFSL